MSNSYYKIDVNPRNSNVALLKKFSLPIFLNLFDLANFLKTEHSTLRRFIYYSEAVNVDHLLYKKFKIAKKSGGFREIITPNEDLKRIQFIIYENILSHIEPSQFAFAYRKGYSTVSNAREHLNSKVIYAIDLKDFFTSIKFDKVHTLFKSLGYSGYISYVLALMCTVIPRSLSHINGNWEIKPNELPYLPQGACTSPAISNLVCIKFDNQLNHIAEKYGFVFSRYADDITFSSQKNIKISNNFRKEIAWCVIKNGFSINRKKEKYSCDHNYQMVNGINVQNSELTLPRKWIKNLRSALFHLKMDYKKMIEEEILNMLKNIEGRCAYAIMVNKEKYSHFFNELKSIKNTIMN